MEPPTPLAAKTVVEGELTAIIVGAADDVVTKLAAYSADRAAFFSAAAAAAAADINVPLDVTTDGALAAPPAVRKGYAVAGMKAVVGDVGVVAPVGYAAAS